MKNGYVHILDPKFIRAFKVECSMMVFSAMLLLSLLGIHSSAHAQTVNYEVYFEIAKPYNNRPTENIFVIRVHSQNKVIEQNVSFRNPGIYSVTLKRPALPGPPERVEIGTAWPDTSFAIGNFLVRTSAKGGPIYVSEGGKKLTARGQHNIGSLPVRLARAEDTAAIFEIKNGDRIYLQSERGYFLTFDMDSARQSFQFPTKTDAVKLYNDAWALVGTPGGFAQNPVKLGTAPERYLWVVHDYRYNPANNTSTIRLQPYFKISNGNAATAGNPWFLDGDNDNSVMVSNTETETTWVVDGKIQGILLKGYAHMFSTDLYASTFFHTTEEAAFKIPGVAKAMFKNQYYSQFNMVDRGDPASDEKKDVVLRRYSSTPQRWGIIIDRRHEQ